jgi:hypothetical protein
MLSLLLAIASSGPASAWTHTYWVWNADDLPRSWNLVTGEDDSIPWDQIEPTISDSYDNWVDSCPCADLRHDPQGETDVSDGGFDLDSFTTHTFEDPHDQLDDGAWAAALCFPTGQVLFNRSGHNYYEVSECDIVYNDHSDWISSEDFTTGTCSGEVHLESVATHEIGHTWGMGHSCEEGDPCDEPELRDATMFWAVDTCDDGQLNQTDDDVAGMYSMYGPSCQFAAVEGSDLYSGAPLDVCYDVVCTAEPDSVTWSMGDGSIYTVDEFPDMVVEETGPDRMSYSFSECYTYETRGQFSVGMDATGQNDACGIWEADQIERAYVLVCGEPVPAEGFDGLFTFDHYDGLVYQMVNQTDTTVYGCIDQIQWDVFEGDTLIDSVSAWSPKIEFPSDGKYRVVLNVGGPGGYSAAELSVDAFDHVGDEFKGCATAPAAAGFAGLLVGLAGILRRRRES